MSVAIFNDDIYIPVSTERYFIKYWEKAILDLNIKTFGNGINLYRSDISQILIDLNNIQDWANKNIIDREDLSYILDRIKILKVDIPNLWTKNYPTLYMG